MNTLTNKCLSDIFFLQYSKGMKLYGCVENMEQKLIVCSPTNNIPKNNSQ